MNNGLVLSGGGGKGAYQIGVIKALKENGYLDNIKYLSGTSIGAVNCLLYAMDDIDNMYNAWNDINLQTIFDIDPEMVKNQNYHFSRDEMLNLVEKYINFSKISNCSYKIYNTICNVSTMPVSCEYRLLCDYDKETIKKIMLASTALPVLYEPVLIDGNYYQDGGLCDNTPIKPLYDAGIRNIIVIELHKDYNINLSLFPGANITIIAPSYDLGEFVEGTLNFSSEAINFRQMLGYKDGLRAIKTKFEKNEMYIRLEPVLAQNDYNEIMMKTKTDRTYKSLEVNINHNLNKFNEIAKKYDKY